MKCFKCSEKMKVIDIEIKDNGNTKIYKCEKCNVRIKLHYEGGKVKKAEVEGASF